MPSVGVFVLLVLGVKHLWRLEGVKKQCSPLIFQITIISIFLFFVLTTIQQNLHARSAISMFERSIYYQPNNARMHYSLGLEKGIRGLAKEAEQSFRKALALEPNQPIARIGLGKALCDQGKYWQGIQEYEKVMNPGRLEGMLKENKMIAYQNLIDSYKKRLVKDSRNAQLHFSLGVMYSKTQKVNQAIQEYEKTLEIEPNHKNAQFNLKVMRRALGIQE